MRRSNRLCVKGFSLLELLVASAIMLGLSTVMIALFASSKQTMVHGSNKLVIQQMARYSMNRILPYLQTVVPLTDTTKPILAMDNDPSKGIGSSGRSISFSTTHDFFTFPEPVFTPRNPTYYFYRISFETTPNRQIYLEKVQPNAPLAPPTPPVLIPFSPAEKRVLTHGDKQAEAFGMSQASIKLKDVVFTWVRQGEMAVSIDVDGPVRGANNQLRTVDYHLDTRIQFPYYANR